MFNRRSTVIFRRWIGIDLERRLGYRPYSRVGESASTVDIDRDISTGRYTTHRPIDETCGNLSPNLQARFCKLYPADFVG